MAYFQIAIIFFMLFSIFTHFGSCTLNLKDLPLSNDITYLQKRVENNILVEMNKDFGWDHGKTPFAVSALSLSNSHLFSCKNFTGTLIKKELQLELLKLLLRKRNNHLSSGQLAMYIIALKSLCIDPHDFSGMNLVSMMRHQSVTSRYEESLKFLALCITGHKLSKESISNLTKTFKLDSKSINDGLDTQAMAALAILCSNKKNQNTFAYGAQKDIVSLFKKFQRNDGSFGNIYSTALVTQVFIAADEQYRDAFMNFRHALKNIKTHYLDDNFKHPVIGDIFVLPVLNAKSLTQLRDKTCMCPSDEKNNVQLQKNNDIWTYLNSEIVDESVILEGATSISDVIPKISVTYSLRISNENSGLSMNISTVVFMDKGETFLNVMDQAAHGDARYLYISENVTFGTLINGISGLTNDAISHYYWLLFKLENDGSLIMQSKGVEEIIPEDGDHFVFMYTRLT